MEASSNQASLPSEQRVSGDMSRLRERDGTMKFTMKVITATRVGQRRPGFGEQMFYGKEGPNKRRHAAASRCEQQRGKRT
jgi:hypothetical protein